MKQYVKLDEWRVMEEGFHPAFNRVSESLFSLANGYMGVRGNFEEDFSGDTLQGSYIGGIYYPEAVSAFRHRKGLPDQVMRMANAANWIGIHVEIDGEALDLARGEIEEFRRVLDMRQGLLERFFQVRLPSGHRVQVRALRFCSMAEPEIGVIRYAITPLNFSGTLTLTPFLDLNVRNEETEATELFWVEVEAVVKRTQAYLVAETRKTEFQVCSGMKFDVFQRGERLEVNSFRIEREKYVACSVDLGFEKGQETVLVKYVANLSSLNHPKEGLLERCRFAVKQAARKGFEQLLEEHRQVWAERWAAGDITIKGDLAAQQAIRFNIFHLHQAYRGDDDRLSVSPKGLTGERYGGCTFWSAEAFCLPFFLATRGREVGRQLLRYRYHHLPKAIENAEKLGFVRGAALYPMITMEGSECSVDWEIALQEIHRNGAIAYAIFEYVRQTGDQEYLLEHGLEVLTAIARFWVQRVHFSQPAQRYVIHGVTGPNEYDNNVNNNWYTNFLTRWCLGYAVESWEWAGRTAPENAHSLAERLHLTEEEPAHWRTIADAMLIPSANEEGVIPQHEGFFEKDLPLVQSLRADERPLHLHWSWDRILRSGFVKRADVLQGLYTFGEKMPESVLRRNFDFYEPRTVHESSLSTAVHAVLAARLGYLEKASLLFIRSARLDLDDYNGDTCNGCHVTSMGGAWLALVRGLAGVRVREGEQLEIRPVIPMSWQAYSFRFLFRQRRLYVEIDHRQVLVRNEAAEMVALWIQDRPVQIAGGEEWVGAY